MPTFIYLILIWLTSWLLPADIRMVWRQKRENELANWRRLADRGEFPRSADSEMVSSSIAELADAIRRCLGEQNVRRFVRGPGIVCAAIAAAVLSLAAVSRGFQGVRILIAAWHRAGFGGPVAMRYNPTTGEAQDLIIATLIPLAIAFAVGAGMLIASQLRFRGTAVRYWAFFVVKLVAVAILVPLLWVEAEAVVRALTPRGELPLIIRAISFRLAFLFAFARAMSWLIADQRSRCPVCLRRLANPVTIGSWSSTFDPPTSESFCEAGHGLLYTPESGTGLPGYWMPLDETWRDLFEPAVH